MFSEIFFFLVGLLYMCYMYVCHVCHVRCTGSTCMYVVPSVDYVVHVEVIVVTIVNCKL